MGLGPPGVPKCGENGYRDERVRVGPGRDDLVGDPFQIRRSETLVDSRPVDKGR